MTDRYKALYDARKEYVLAAAYASEAGLGGAEIIKFAREIEQVLDNYDKFPDKEQLKNIFEKLR